MELNYRSLFLSAVAVTAVAGISYAFYFDYKRRNDVKFRKSLKKAKKEVEKKNATESSNGSLNKLADEEQRLAALFNTIKSEPIPEDPKDGEQYLFYHLNQGEVLARQGPEFYEECAGHIFRAALCTPNPVEMILLTEKMLPRPCYELVAKLYALEVKNLQDTLLQYYEEYPPVEMNIKFQESKDQSGIDNPVFKTQQISSTKAFKEGEVIYTELPLISIVEPSYDGINVCGHCLREIDESADKIESPFAYVKSVYCSADCLEAVKDDFVANDSATDSATKVITDAQTSNKKIPAMMARLLNRVFKKHAERTQKGLPKEKTTPMQHIERFTSTPVLTSHSELVDEDVNVQKYIDAENPGISEIIDINYYKGMKTKFLSGTFGFSTVNKNELANPDYFNDGFRVVTPGPITGHALYIFSSYLTNDISDANVKITFPEGTHKLTLVALKDIEAGTILSIAAEESKSAQNTSGDVSSSNTQSIELIDAEDVSEEQQQVAEALQAYAKELQQQMEQEISEMGQEPEEGLIVEITEEDQLEEDQIEEDQIEEDQLEVKVEVESIEKEIISEEKSEVVEIKTEVELITEDLSSSQEFEKVDEVSTPGFESPKEESIETELVPEQST